MRANLIHGVIVLMEGNDLLGWWYCSFPENPFFFGIVPFVWRDYKLDLLLEIKKVIVVKITFLIFIGVLLSSMYAMAVGKLSGDMINELFSIANGILVR